VNTSDMQVEALLKMQAKVEIKKVEALLKMQAKVEIKKNGGAPTGPWHPAGPQLAAAHQAYRHCDQTRAARSCRLPRPRPERLRPTLHSTAKEERLKKQMCAFVRPKMYLRARAPTRGAWS